MDKDNVPSGLSIIERGKIFLSFYLSRISALRLPNSDFLKAFECNNLYSENGSIQAFFEIGFGWYIFS